MWSICSSPLSSNHSMEREQSLRRGSRWRGDFSIVFEMALIHRGCYRLSWPSSISRAVQESPRPCHQRSPPLRQRSRKLEPTFKIGEVSLTGDLASKASERDVHRANGEEAGEISELILACSGMDPVDLENRGLCKRTVKTWPSQPAFM